MEDAMIINKASLDRGFAHGTIHKTEEIDLKKKAQDQGSTLIIFGKKYSDSRYYVKSACDQYIYIGV